jgi:hypothetical protein
MVRPIANVTQKTTPRRLIASDKVSDDKAQNPKINPKHGTAANKNRRISTFSPCSFISGGYITSRKERTERTLSQDFNVLKLHKES